jgi:dihydrofolate reductase
MAGHLVYGLAVSVDGYIARGQGGDIGLPVPEEALHRHFNEMQARTALNLYGRNMYEVMKYWDAPPAESSEWEQEFARAWQATPKVVFSTTLDTVGPNARLVKQKADVERTVRQLKAETAERRRRVVLGRNRGGAGVDGLLGQQRAAPGAE